MNLPGWAITFLTIMAGLGVMAAGLGYLVGTFRKSTSQAATDAVETWRAEYEAEKQRAERFAAENKAKDAEINNLKGQVTQLTTQVAELRALIMGEQVQPALKEAMERTSSEQHGFTRDFMDQRFAAFQKAFLNGLLTLSQDFREALHEHFPKEGT